MGNLTTPKSKNEYKCEQDELYGVCTHGIISLKENITQFAAHKPKYTLAYATELSDELAAAAAIPGISARNIIAEMIRNNLETKVDQCVNEWQIFKTYVKEAFVASMHRQVLEAAGSKFYRKASNYNWEKVSSLMDAASQFMTNYATELLANGNMPPAFHAAFDTLRVDTFNLYVQYQDALKNAQLVTSQKILANNAIYKKITTMFKDGQLIFRNDAILKSRFIFASVLQQVRGTSTACHEFEVPKNESIKIKKLVANTPFTNIGETDLVVCIGDVNCTVGTGTSVPAGATIIMQEGVATITVLNISQNKKGYCKVRVIKK